MCNLHNFVTKIFSSQIRWLSRFFLQHILHFRLAHGKMNKSVTGPASGRLHVCVYRCVPPEGRLLSHGPTTFLPRSLPTMRWRDVLRLLSPGVGTEGADESYVPLEWVAPEAHTQSAASSCRESPRMNTLSGHEPREARTGTPVRPTIWRCIYPWHVLQVWTCPVRSEWRSA